jgi:hypothetical protein
MWFILVGKSFQELKIGGADSAEDQDSHQQESNECFRYLD